MRFKLHTSSHHIVWNLRWALSLSYLHGLAYPAATVPQGQCSNNLYFTYQWPQCARVVGKTLLSSLACPALPTTVLTLQLTKLKCGGWGPSQEDLTEETSVPLPMPPSPQPCLNTHSLAEQLSCENFPPPPGEELFTLFNAIHLTHLGNTLDEPIYPDKRRRVIS